MPEQSEETVREEFGRDNSECKEEDWVVGWNVQVEELGVKMCIMA